MPKTDAPGLEYTMDTKPTPEVEPHPPDEETGPRFNEQTNYVPVKTIITVRVLASNIVPCAHQTRYSWPAQVLTC